MANGSDPDFQDQLSHIAGSYDDLPYDDHPINRTHPSRLAGTARLFGFAAAPAETARVLELGCGTGANLIPLAMFYPGSRHLGIDLSAVQIADGQSRIERHGLSNIELRCASITDLDDTLGEFDYIIAHGVYSWVPEPVRDKILAICGAHLAPGGVAYISYNVLPGWRVRQPLRDALRLCVRPDQSPVARSAEGRKFIRYLSEMTVDQTAYGQALREVPGGFGDVSDSYLFHEYMEEINEPVAFSDFIAAVGQHGLGFLSETELKPMFAQFYGPDFAQKLSQTVPDDVIAYGQMLDILTGNTFRTTLLVPSASTGQIDRMITLERLRSLHFIGSHLLAFERKGSVVTLKSRDGQTKTYDEPVAIHLVERFYDGIQTSRSFAEAVDGIADGDMVQALEILMVMLIGGLVFPLDTPLTVASVSDFPRASPLAQGDVAAGRKHTASRTHVSIRLDESMQFLLPLLDGTRSHEALASLLREAIRSDEIKLSSPDGKPPPEEALPEISEAMVARSLHVIAGAGLLEA